MMETYLDSTLGRCRSFRLTILRTASSVKKVFATRRKKENTDTWVTHNTEFVDVLLVQMQRGTKAIKDLKGLWLVLWDDCQKFKERRSGMDWEFGVSRCKLLHLEWINNEVLLYSTGNYVQSLGIDHDGRQYEKGNIYVCMTESVCCTAEIITTL